jgi:hypothetical protein
LGKLHLPPGGRYYRSRHCYRLTYTSCRESHKSDALDRRVAAALGWCPADVRRIMSRIGKKRGDNRPAATLAAGPGGP